MKINSNRTGSWQLPEVEELRNIMKEEACRKLPPEKKDNHYPHFHVMDKWLEKIKVRSNLSKIDGSWEEVVIEGMRIENDIVSRTLRLEDAGIADEVYDYLGEEDELGNVEVIFVFGSKSLTRIEKAVHLYEQGWGKKIFISGSHPAYGNRVPEADVFRDWAVEHGVDVADIIVENKSLTIADNVRRSLNMMDEIGLSFSKMIIIAPWFAQRRCWSFMMKYIPVGRSVVRVNSDVSSNGDYSKKNWWKNEKGIRVVFNEFVKMKIGIVLNTS